MTFFQSYFRIFLLGLVLSSLLFGLFLLIQPPAVEKPYLKILGGGFVFNYRIAEVFAGFTAIPEKPMPVGTRLLARFENPSGAEDIVVERSLGLPDRRLLIRSPPLKGVIANKVYRINIELYEGLGNKPFWSTSLTIRSQIGDGDFPDKPLTVGPGYHQPYLMEDDE